MPRLLTPAEAAATKDSPDVLVARHPYGGYLFLALSAEAEELFSRLLRPPTIAVDEYDALPFFDQLLDEGLTIG